MIYDFSTLFANLLIKSVILKYQKWGALIRRAEIIPLHLIRVMPAEGKRSDHEKYFIVSACGDAAFGIGTG